MSKVGASIIRGLEQAIAHAAGAAGASRRVIHSPEKQVLNSRVRRMQRPPLHPGEMLREEFLIPLGMTARVLAHSIQMPAGRVIAIVEERRGLDGEMCLRLARYFRMTPRFWMNLQKAFELETSMQDWQRICREVPMHPRDPKTKGLKVRARA